MGGLVVHARKGDRARYQPLQSRLSISDHPESVVAAFLGLYSFRTIYIADLDAISGKGNNIHAIRRIRQRFPELEIWLDCGICDAVELTDFCQHGLRYPVLGSETLCGISLMREAASVCPGFDIVLSLDFRGSRFLGPQELQMAAELWPQRVILMALTRVGSGAGPDLDLLGTFLQRSPTTAFYVAGGVRDAEDLAHLAALGVKGALVATALHGGTLGREALAAIQKNNATPPPQAERGR